MFKLKVILSLILSLFFVSNSFSKDNVKDKEALYKTVAEFNDAITKKNYKIFADSISNKFIEEMAKEIHLDKVNLKDSLAERISNQVKKTSNPIYKMDGKKAVFNQTKSGLFYALIPLHVEGNDFTKESVNLAVLEKGKWSFIYGGPSLYQSPLFLKIYPELTNMPLEPEKIDNRKK